MSHFRDRRNDESMALLDVQQMLLAIIECRSRRNGRPGLKPLTTGNQQPATNPHSPTHVCRMRM
jgi:hypothetical protein